uniref:Structural polyprotein n=1 Tax=Bastrovirus/VietNam/Rat/14294_55 TaxID=1906174 RepID=A0A1L6BZY7_9VIRU|nr:structural polyprotein [Bastrovirus/VietNam/Rat/14294_55]
MPKQAQPQAKAPAKKGNPTSKPKNKPSKPKEPIVPKLSKRITALEKKDDGPKVADQFTCTVNLGVVNAAEVDDFTRSMQVFLSPLLLKDVNEASARTTPLSTRASQYSMYRISHLRIDVLPLVGASGVGGTTGLLSLQLDSSQGAAVNYDAVATRPHVVLLPGQRTSFKPKAPVGTGFKGGWYYTNTAANDGAACLGPSAEVFLLGRTTNIYTNSPFTGPLFRLSAHATYQFANYTPNPALATMQTDLQETRAEVSTNERGEIVVSFDTPLLGGAFHTTRPGIGDAIFAVLDTVGGLASQVPVLGPLLDTGLAFLKPIFKSNTGFATAPTHDYLVCGSFDQAKVGNALTTNKGLNGPVEVSLQCQQLTPMSDGSSVAPVGPESTITLPHKYFEMTPVDSAKFAITCPFFGGVTQETLPSEGGVGRVPSLRINQVIKCTQYANVNQQIETDYIGLRDFDYYLANQAAEQDILVKWHINPPIYQPTNSAVLQHKGTVADDYSGYLGRLQDLCAQADLLPSMKSPEGWTQGWLTVASTPDPFKVPVGTRLVCVHYNIWQPTMLEAGIDPPRQQRFGWLMVEPNGSQYVLGFYDPHVIKNGAVNLQGVLHSFTITDSRDIAGWAGGKEIAKSVQSARCLPAPPPGTEPSTSSTVSPRDSSATRQTSRWQPAW